MSIDRAEAIIDQRKVGYTGVISRGGVIDATIDHAAAVLVSKEAHDAYSTLEPQAAFHKRITFCLNIHNDAVKAMSYPPDAHKDELPDAETLKKCSRKRSTMSWTKRPYAIPYAV